MKEIYVAVDGGLDGGIVGVNKDGEVDFAEVMPVIGKKGKGKRAYDIKGMNALIAGRDIKVAYLEFAQSFPGNASSANFSIGYGYGIWQAILTLHKIPIVIVRPKEWQKVMFHGMDKKDTKRNSMLVASRLAPKEDWRASERCKNMHDGKTDGFCIARWGIKQL